MQNDEIKSIHLSDKNAFLFLLPYAKGFIGLSLLGLGLLILASLSGIASSLYLAKVIDLGILQKSKDNTLYYASFVLVLEFVAIIAVYFGRKIFAYTASHILYNIRDSLFKHIQNLPLSFYDKTPQGRIVTRLTHDVEGLEEFFSTTFGRLGNAFLLAMFSGFAILFTHSQLGIVVSLTILPTILITILTRNPIRTMNWDMSKKSSNINARLSEYLQGMSIIRAFGLENFSKSKFDLLVEEHLVSSRNLNRFYTFVRPIVSFFIQMPILVLILYGGYLVGEGIISLGLLIAYFRYTERFTNPIEMISREIHVLQQAFTSAERVADFLAQKTEESVFKESKNYRALVQGKVEFQNVGMSYNPGEKVLDQISFQVEVGQKIGILGRTGSGKTSLISLLFRLYPYQEGQIFIDNVPIEDWNRDYLREQIGLVSQDVFIFKGSLRDNLKMSKDYSDEKIEKAILESGFLQVMKRKNIDLDHQILDQGSNLSVGERQLLSITRVLLQNPRILILDEATANIDHELEELIQKTLEKIVQDRTTFVIAHRLQTLQFCEKLLVFKNGKLIAEGNHDELLTKSPYYKELYRFSIDTAYNEGHGIS